MLHVGNPLAPPPACPLNCHATGLTGEPKGCFGCQQCQVVSLSRTHRPPRGEPARGLLPGSADTHRSYEELKYPSICCVSLGASCCLSPRFKCPVMKSTEPPAPGLLPALSRFFYLSSTPDRPPPPLQAIFVPPPNVSQLGQHFCGFCFTFQSFPPRVVSATCCCSSWQHSALVQQVFWQHKQLTGVLVSWWGKIFNNLCYKLFNKILEKYIINSLISQTFLLWISVPSLFKFQQKSNFNLSVLLLQQIHSHSTQNLIMLNPIPFLRRSLITLLNANKIWSEKNNNYGNSAAQPVVFSSYSAQTFCRVTGNATHGLKTHSPKCDLLPRTDIVCYMIESQTTHDILIKTHTVGLGSGSW